MASTNNVSPAQNESEYSSDVTAQTGMCTTYYLMQRLIIEGKSICSECFNYSVYDSYFIYFFN